MAHRATSTEPYEGAAGPVRIIHAVTTGYEAETDLGPRFTWSKPKMSQAPITVLVVDDEPPARERLRVLLTGEPGIDIVSECTNGLQALAAITQLRPELVFLDVQMPDLDGLGVIAALGADDMPETIFVTAHDAYMEQAFELHAVDYLRKPYTNARFTSALEHARKHVHARRAESVGQGGPVPGARESKYTAVLATLQDLNIDPRLAVQDAKTGTWHIVSKNEIDVIHANGAGGVEVHVGPDSYRWHKTLSELERTLDPHTFLRIHRSYIVNVRRIRQVKPLQKGEYAVILEGKHVLDSGRTYREAIERFLAERG